jgi:methyl-accepting chemotaxis protein
MAEENTHRSKEKKMRTANESGTKTAGTQRIMVKPLPEILDELDGSISLASEAAKDAREAAEEARRAGEKAASEAARVAAEAIARVEEMAKNAMQLAELLNSAVKDALVAIEKRLSEKS